MDFPTFVDTVGGWFVANRGWLLVYFGGYPLYLWALRYVVREAEVTLSVVLWPVLVVIATLYAIIVELPRLVFRLLTGALRWSRIDRALDWVVWYVFKRAIDETERGRLYVGPGPRARPIHRLRVVDPSLGKTHWLTVPRSVTSANRAFAWGFGFENQRDIIDLEILAHV